MPYFYRYFKISSFIKHPTYTPEQEKDIQLFVYSRGCNHGSILDKKCTNELPEFAVQVADAAGSQLSDTTQKDTKYHQQDIVTDMAGRRESGGGLGTVMDGFQTVDHSMGKSVTGKGIFKILYGVSQN